MDIRSPFGNPAFVVTRRLISLGATVETTRNTYVTHVIFRYGDPMTKLWAEKRGLCIVAPAWVKACVEQKVRRLLVISSPSVEFRRLAIT